MVERGKHLRSRAKRSKPIGIGCQRRWQHFEGNLAFQPRIDCAIDLSHAAGAQERDDFINPDPGATLNGMGNRAIIFGSG
jgi:hypothetical protein